MRRDYNEATRRALERCGALHPHVMPDDRRGAPSSTSPTMFVVEDPVTDVEEELLRYTDENPDARRDDARVARRLREMANAGVQLDAEGVPVLNGRRCCFELSRELDGKMHRLALPSEHLCPGCGTRWRVETRVREERHHGR